VVETDLVQGGSAAGRGALDIDLGDDIGLVVDLDDLTFLQFGGFWHGTGSVRSEEHTSELQSREKLVCRLLLEKKKLFQLWYASPLPFVFGVGILNDTEARAVHLWFALFLAYTFYPSLRSSPRRNIQIGRAHV